MPWYSLLQQHDSPPTDVWMPLVELGHNVKVFQQGTGVPLLDKVFPASSHIEVMQGDDTSGGKPLASNEGTRGASLPITQDKVEQDWCGLQRLNGAQVRAVRLPVTLKLCVAFATPTMPESTRAGWSVFNPWKPGLATISRRMCKPMLSC